MFYRFRTGNIGLTLIILMLHTRIKEMLSAAMPSSSYLPAAFAMASSFASSASASSSSSSYASSASSSSASLASAPDSVSDATLRSLSALYTASVASATAPIAAASMSAFAGSAATPANILPYFDFDVQRNLTVTVGQTGFLHCRVERLGDKDVSWIRKRDLHILTAGTTVYTSDQRFQVNRPKNSSNWTLQIKYPQLRDAGVYECQINTEPKMSLFYTFNVVELKANILGPTDLYVKSGSDINLTCNISQGPHELGNIFWYKGNEIVDMVASINDIHSDSSTPRITVDTDWADGLISRLKIRRATVNDTGNYSCVPTIAKPSCASVHVINGEFPAAMQHNAASRRLTELQFAIAAGLVAISVAAGMSGSNATVVASRLGTAAVIALLLLLLHSNPLASDHWRRFVVGPAALLLLAGVAAAGQRGWTMGDGDVGAIDTSTSDVSPWRKRQWPDGSEAGEAEEERQMTSAISAAR